MFQIFKKLVRRYYMYKFPNFWKISAPLLHVEGPRFFKN
jgi:hypothetical protein